MPTRCRLLLTLTSSAVAACLLLGARPARADFEEWNWIEVRTPLVRPGGFLPRIDLRLWTDIRFNQRNDGLHQLFFRAGPLIHVTPWLLLALHGTIYADRVDGAFEQEARAELEPNFYGRFGPWFINDRNRLEYRWRDYGQRGRYRNQLRVHYDPLHWNWLLIVWDELFVDLNRLQSQQAGINQNRFFVGVGRKWLRRTSRVEIGYMLRSRRAPDYGPWAHDHALLIYLYLDFSNVGARPRRAVPPPPSPLFEDTLSGS